MSTTLSTPKASRAGTPVAARLHMPDKYVVKSKGGSKEQPLPELLKKLCHGKDTHKDVLDELSTVVLTTARTDGYRRSVDDKIIDHTGATQILNHYLLSEDGKQFQEKFMPQDVGPRSGNKAVGKRLHRATPRTSGKQQPTPRATVGPLSPSRNLMGELEAVVSPCDVVVQNLLESIELIDSKLLISFSEEGSPGTSIMNLEHGGLEHLACLSGVSYHVFLSLMLGVEKGDADCLKLVAPTAEQIVDQAMALPEGPCEYHVVLGDTKIEHFKIGHASPEYVRYTLPYSVGFMHQFPPMRAAPHVRMLRPTIHYVLPPTREQAVRAVLPFTVAAAISKQRCNGNVYIRQRRVACPSAEAIGPAVASTPAVAEPAIGPGEPTWGAWADGRGGLPVTSRVEPSDSPAPERVLRELYVAPNTRKQMEKDGIDCGDVMIPGGVFRQSVFDTAFKKAAVPSIDMRMC